MYSNSFFSFCASRTAALFSVFLFLTFCNACDGVGTDDDTSSPQEPAKLACSDIDGFTQESATFGLVGSSLSFTTITVGHDERVNGHDVVRTYIQGETPDGLGEYIGCDSSAGFVDVATDSWDANDPDNKAHHQLNLWEPPLFLCGYGEAVGASCIWEGLFDNEAERSETKVLAYESVTVPFGQFDSAMKIEVLSYHEGILYDGPLHFWVHPAAGIVRVADVERGDVIELINFVPASAGKRYAVVPSSSFRLTRKLLQSNQQRSDRQFLAAD